MATHHKLQEEQIRLAEQLFFTGRKKSSFAKMLYAGTFHGERVFPFPRVSREERYRVDTFLSKLNAFANEQIDPDWIDRHASIPNSVIEGLGKLGLLGLTIPVEYGGLGFTQYGYCRAIECIAHRCGSTALFVNAHQSIGLKALLLFGTDKQRKRWLPPLARGEILAAFALTEAQAGSDASNVQTRAVFDPANRVYRINGQKQWVTNGSIAQILTVMAKTEVDTPEGKQEKITAFLVTPDMPGFKVTATALEKCGVRGTTTSKLAFEDMEVPADNILGPLGGGLKVALTVLNYGRTTFGASCTGAAKEMLRRAIAHARNRYQFQRPLASFPLVKKKLATMARLTYAMDATTYMTAGLLDGGEEDFMLETAMLKVFASDALWIIIYETMQILGGRSFFTDEPYERMMRDARLNMIGEGSNEVLRAFIGLVGIHDIGMQLKEVADRLRHPFSGFRTLVDFGQQNLARLLRRPKIPIKSNQLDGEAHQLGSAIRRFGIATIRLLARYREDIVEQQITLDRIATCALALYTTTAVLSKLDAELAQTSGNANQQANDLAVGKLYCVSSFATIDRALSSLFNNNDATIEAVSDKLVGTQRNRCNWAS